MPLSSPTRTENSSKASPQTDVSAKRPGRGWRALALPFLVGILVAALPLLGYKAFQAKPPEISQDDIDAAVMNTLETKSLPAQTAKAAEAVRQSVVLVRGYLDEDAETEQAKAGKDLGKDASKSKADSGDARTNGDKAGPNVDKTKPNGGSAGTAADKAKAAGKKPDGPDDNPEIKKLTGVGSGVVIVDSGIILTSLHVVANMKRVMVTFFDGSESEAVILSVHPENDLAVLKAKSIPDDLPAATLGSPSALRPGDTVVAVGFPFGIGPSVSAGVVSGLNREFKVPGDGRVLSRLIQFDAAANPGNSGGPLVNADGDVVGIVTAIYNPSGTGTFAGLGFAVTIAVAGNAVGVSPF
ncbi:MAG TPA: trypsin-like peptidase domain-containing protein [Burkholderiales bacterium]|nr:trypsin-like peptidase domain-containing protein [Burkholderiales bacterium]